jgi:hypothetical protein
LATTSEGARPCASPAIRSGNFPITVWQHINREAHVRKCSVEAHERTNAASISPRAPWCRGYDPPLRRLTRVVTRTRAGPRRARAHPSASAAGSEAGELGDPRVVGVVDAGIERRAWGPWRSHRARRANPTASDRLAGSAILPPPHREAPGAGPSLQARLWRWSARIVGRVFRKISVVHRRRARLAPESHERRACWSEQQPSSFEG